jgi:undecaprenyl-diphosphatase
LKGAALVATDTSVDLLVIATGTLVSAITAFLCIKAFMAFVTRVGFIPFVCYRVILAIVLFGLFI